MNRRHFLAAIGAYAIIPPPSASGQGKEPPAKPLERPGTPIRRVLPSGLRLIVVERPGAALTAISLAVRAGSGDEEPTRAGTLHLIEHLVFKGTQDKPPGTFDALIEGAGGELGARTLRDATFFEVTLPVVGWKTALRALAELTLHPAFRAEDLEAEKKVVRSEIALESVDPVRAGMTAVSSVLFTRGEPYAHPLVGTVAQVAKLTSEELQEVHTACYRPARMTLCVVGPVAPQEIWVEAAQLFDGPKVAPVVRPLRLALQTSLKRTENGLRAPADPAASQRELVTVVLGWATPPAADLNSITGLILLAELLAKGESGRLAAPLVVQQEAALQVSAELVVQRCAGLFVLSATATRKQAEKLEEATLAQLRRVLEDGFSETEVAAARASVLGRIATERASVEGLARRLVFYDALEVPGLEEEIEKRLPEIPGETLQSLMRTLLYPGNRAVALFGPGGTPE